MSSITTLQGFLAGACVEDAVFALRPDDRVCLPAPFGFDVNVVRRLIAAGTTPHAGGLS